jgi:hypothetical protein
LLTLLATRCASSLGYKFTIFVIIARHFILFFVTVTFHFYKVSNR